MDDLCECGHSEIDHVAGGGGCNGKNADFRLSNTGLDDCYCKVYKAEDAIDAHVVR